MKWIFWCVVSMVAGAALLSGVGLLLNGPAPVAAAIGAVLAYVEHDWLEAKVNQVRRWVRPDRAVEVEP